MNRTEKKCLIAAMGTHLFLILLLVFGSAFFVPEPRPIPAARLTVVPSVLVDAALSGGGGNPNVKPSDERLKGDTLVPQPEEPEPAAPPKPVEPPKAKPEPPKPVEPPKAKPEPERSRPESKAAEKPAEAKKGPPKEAPELVLKPVSKAEARKLLESSGSGARAAAQGESRRQAAQMAGAIERLRAGYADGTAVEVHGTGGVAYANYAQFIFEIYDQAWIIDKDMAGEDAVTRVQVIIERSGRVREARIIRPSGNAALDATVQKALNRVRTVPPFPEGSKDRERTFFINFNLKAKLSSA